MLLHYNNNWGRLSLEPNFRLPVLRGGLPEECSFLGTTVSDFWTFELNKLDKKLGDDDEVNDDLLEDAEALPSSNSKLRDWATGNSTSLTRLPSFFLR